MEVNPGMQDRQRVVLGVTGSIAAYKAAQLCSNLCKTGLDVHVIMTYSATRLICPQTFETLSGNRVYVDTFDRNHTWNVEHIALAKCADVFLIAPATANIIAKMAHGIADDMLSTTLLAARCPKIVCPAMNTGMYDNPATQENFRTIESRGAVIVDVESGFLACGDEGKGRFASFTQIEEAVSMALHVQKPLAGKHVLVSAGATRECMDPVRFMTNHSTGKMGYAIARAARDMGARVTLLSANTVLEDPFGVHVIRASSAQLLYEASLRAFADADYTILAAAVADYRPSQVSEQKIKKLSGGLMLELERTQDILAALCARRRPGQKICGTSMETENLVENSTEKLYKKGCDMIVANCLSTPGAGFGVDTNVVTVITAQGAQELPLMSKSALGYEILKRMINL